MVLSPRNQEPCDGGDGGTDQADDDDVEKRHVAGVGDAAPLRRVMIASRSVMPASTILRSVGHAGRSGIKHTWTRAIRWRVKRVTSSPRTPMSSKIDLHPLRSTSTLPAYNPATALHVRLGSAKVRGRLQEDGGDAQRHRDADRLGANGAGSDGQAESGLESGCQ